MATGDVNGVVNALQTQNTLISQMVKALTAANALLVSGVTIKPALSAAGQAFSSGVAAPASTTAFTMQGLAGTVTPILSGIVLLIVSGVIISTSGTAGDGIVYQIYSGTGAPPVNGAALTGTASSGQQFYKNQATVTAANVAAPFSIQAIVTGVSTGIVHWFDLAAESLGTASAVGFADLSLTAVEV